MEEIRMQEILKLMPHRYPFLLIDRIIDISDCHIVAIKNITVNEPQFTGHFPEMPIMPGVLMIEAMAQASGILCYKKLIEDMETKFMFFATVNNAKFKTPVVPGDTLKLTITLDRFNGRLLKVHGKGEVGENLACEAQLGLWLVDKKDMQIK